MSSRNGLAAEWCLDWLSGAVDGMTEALLWLPVDMDVELRMRLMQRWWDVLDAADAVVGDG